MTAVPALIVPATTKPTPVTIYSPSIMNSTGSEADLNSPEEGTLDFSLGRNYFKISRPSPLTLETLKIGTTPPENRPSLNFDTF